MFVLGSNAYAWPTELVAHGQRGAHDSDVTHGDIPNEKTSFNLFPSEVEIER
jgi:hypothetical protein